MARTLSAQEAADLLGVSRATLYAYVSRGLIRSEGASGATRERRYRFEDVDALVARKTARRDPARAVQDALHWGAPLLESALTLVQDGALYYRGEAATDLAVTAGVEEVAALLWTGASHAVAHLPLRARLSLAPAWPSARLPEAYAHALTHAAAHDLRVRQRGEGQLPASAARILVLLYAVTERAAGVPPAPDLPLHARLARAWAPRAAGAPDLLRAALILCADHELNVSSFTARCAASGGANLAHATLAGLCALQGHKHGLLSVACLELLLRAEQNDPREVLREALERGPLPGFGHRLYPDGDPRARSLLNLAATHFPDRPALRSALALARVAHEELGEWPTVDFALAALGRVLNLDADRVLALFALGRTVGWLAHAIEAARNGQLLRPRAKYVGPAPFRYLVEP